MTEAPSRAIDPHPRRRVAVLDTELSFVDTGRGDPIVFLHGNPTSSYLWRNIIPHVSDHGRCLAPDLMGMGQSGKSPTGAYRFVDHARYLDAWFDAVGLTRNVILVVHDWGSALGFHRAARYPAQIEAVAYMEAIAMPRRWQDFGEAADLFRALRSEKGEEMILERNFFVETVLPREIPVEGQPADVTAIVERYATAMCQSPVPKLLVVGDPGAIVRGRTLEFCRTWRNQTEVTVKGVHFLQEDSPDDIGRALKEFVESVRKRP